MITRQWLNANLPAGEPLTAVARALSGSSDLADQLRWLAAAYEADQFPRPDWKRQPADGFEFADPVRIDGLGYKGNEGYLTAEGWPLGVPCWYFRVECGWREYIAAEDPVVATERAVIFVHCARAWRDTAPQKRPSIGEFVQAFMPVPA